MSVSQQQRDWKFECDISGCSLNEKVYYTNWHLQEPQLPFIKMLQIMTQLREESDREEMERYEEDMRYYAEEEERLLKEEEEEEEQSIDWTAELKEAMEALKKACLVTIEECKEEIEE
jgi:hypothetical protein